MSYAAKQDMIDRFGEEEIRQLTDKRNPPAGAIDDAVLARALEDADGDIDAAVSGRYALPLPSIPKVLVRVACNLARYYLYDDRAGEEVTRRYKDERAFLDAVAKGLNTLGVDATGADVKVASGGVEFNTDTTRRAFGTDDEGSREFG